MTGTLTDGLSPRDFEQLFLDEVGIHIKYETEVATNPDLDEDGYPVPETGGRNDVFFYVADEDVKKLAYHPLHLHGKVRWWEDVVYYNDNAYLYPDEFLDKYPNTWINEDEKDNETNELSM